ncbi:MAG: amidohydrolase [Spongiibacteraceae bacterium]|nr:amidohydrolase [Spongiibacteraceae bacterium]
MNKKIMDRRNFLHLSGQCAAVSMLSGGLAASAIASKHVSPKGAGVFVGSQRVPVIDLHAHCAFSDVKELIRGTPFDRDFKIRLLGPERLQAMAARRVDIQVLSINQYWWYKADKQLASDIVRLHDEQMKAWCSLHEGRFVGLTSVALQFPELAAEQLEYAVKELGLKGASVGGHVNGVVPTGSEFDPFWAKAEELDVPVFVHPGGAHNILREGALEGRGDLGNIVGNPLETTLFLTKMIFDGTLDRFPGLTLCGAHGGGYLPSYLGRTELACEYRRDANCANKRKPSEYLRDQIVVDSMIFSQEGLRHLYEEVGASQIVFGTDIPFRWPDALDIILEAPYLTDAEKIAILGGNLQRILKLT